MNQHEGFETFVKSALEKEGKVTFRIDWMGNPKLIAHSATWAAPRNIDSLNSFSTLVKRAFKVTDADYMGGDLRGDTYRLKDRRVLSFYGSMGELEVTLTRRGAP